MTDEHDELTGIFDDLKPEDFAPRKQGIVAFDAFVKENIRSLRVAYAAADGEINPIAIFASPDNEWTFSPTEDENMGQYIQRLREAAKTLKATWFFISKKTLVGALTATNDGTIPEITNTGWAEQHRQLLTEGVVYYAERLEDGVKDCRHGIIYAEDGALTQVVEGNPNAQSMGLFSNILS